MKEIDTQKKQLKSNSKKKKPAATTSTKKKTASLKPTTKTTKTTPKKKMGRKPLEIDPEMFEKLCSILATVEELCHVFGTTDKTLYNWAQRQYKKPFSEVYNIHAGKGRMSLRRSQFQLAQSSAHMAIWLGKQYLGQVDRREEIISGSGASDKIAKVEIVFKDESNKDRLKKMEKTIVDEIKRGNDI